MREGAHIIQGVFMKLLIGLMALSLIISSAFAGDMSEIDIVTRETVANQYYPGVDQEEYLRYMQSEIWNVKIEEGTEPGCLVVVSGTATNLYTPELDEYNFWVCITRDSDRRYYGRILRDELVIY